LRAVSTVIVAYNSGEFLSRCVTAVRGVTGEVVVVDSASPNGDAAAACREFPDVRLIERSRNDGFGSAANAGVAATSGRWVLLLNPDAWPIDDGLGRLAEWAESRPRLGAAGPGLVDSAGLPQRSTIRPPLGAASLAVWAAFPHAVSGIYAAWRRRTGWVRRGEVGPAEFLQGAVLLVRREAFEQVGGFDESFFMYGEDADLCARLRAAGWGVELCEGARFVHVGGGSSRSHPDRMRLELLRSWLRLTAKLRGIGDAERSRRWLLLAMRLRAATSREASDRAVVTWLRSGHVSELLDPPE
jgi:GT2 family glycosyltransferase